MSQQTCTGTEKWWIPEKVLVRPGQKTEFYVNKQKFPHEQSAAATYKQIKKRFSSFYHKRL